VQPRRFQQLLVLDVPDFLVRPACDIRDELTETPMGLALAQLRNGSQQVRTLSGQRHPEYLTARALNRP
jgi:hypothetical protein